MMNSLYLCPKCREFLMQAYKITIVEGLKKEKAKCQNCKKLVGYKYQLERK